MVNVQLQAAMSLTRLTFFAGFSGALSFHLQRLSIWKLQLPFTFVSHAQLVVGIPFFNQQRKHQMIFQLVTRGYIICFSEKNGSGADLNLLPAVCLHRDLLLEIGAPLARPTPLTPIQLFVLLPAPKIKKR
jgi:hypothetical protein